MTHVPAYPLTDAWLWDVTDIGESLLSRREAAIVSTLSRNTGAMTVADLKRDVEWRRGRHRHANEHVQSADRPAMPDMASETPLQVFHELVGRLRDKGLVGGAQGKAAGPGRPATAWELTDVGRAAAAFVALAAKAILDDRLDPEGKPARLVHALFDSVLSAGARDAVVTSDADGHRVEAIMRGRYSKVAEGSLGAHEAILGHIKGVRQARGKPDTSNVITFDWHAGGGTFRVDYDMQPNPIGMRTTLAFTRA